jgi:hypothetical protein
MLSPNIRPFWIVFLFKTLRLASAVFERGIYFFEVVVLLRGLEIL